MHAAAGSFDLLKFGDLYILYLHGGSHVPMVSRLNEA